MELADGALIANRIIAQGVDSGLLEDAFVATISRATHAFVSNGAKQGGIIADEEQAKVGGADTTTRLCGGCFTLFSVG